MATGTEAKPKPGTLEHKLYMRALGAKGGTVTRDRHPEHLKEIGAMGGRAAHNSHKKQAAAAPVQEAPPVVSVQEIYEDIDAFFKSLDGADG